MCQFCVACYTHAVHNALHGISNESSFAVFNIILQSYLLGRIRFIKSDNYIQLFVDCYAEGKQRH